MANLSLNKINLREFIKGNFGINKHLIYKLFCIFGFNALGAKMDLIWTFITNEELFQIRNFIKEHFITESLLRGKILEYIRIYKITKSYRGTMHLYNLPVHGQRTKTNAQTRKKSKKLNLISLADKKYSNKKLKKKHLVKQQKNKKIKKKNDKKRKK